MMLVVDPDLPGDPAMGFAKRSGHGAIFFHGEFAGLFCLGFVDLTFEFENDVDLFPERHVLPFFSVGVDEYTEPLYRLALFLEDRYDIDPAAAAQSHEQHLHRADAEILAAGLGAAVHPGRMAIGVPGFETKIPFHP